MVFLLQLIVSRHALGRYLSFDLYRITLVCTLLARSYWFAKYPSVDFLLDGFFHRAKENRVEAFKHVEHTRDALKKRDVCTVCREIERFMPRLIDSPRYYELYDFYKKSVLSSRVELFAPFPPFIDIILMLLLVVYMYIYC